MRAIQRSSAPSRVVGSGSASAISGVGALKKPVVLVVDDDEGIHDALHLILDDDCAVLDVADGRAALDLVRAQRVDLMLLDILMPDIDGIEILQELRAFEPHLPVIMMTAVKTVLTAVEAMKLGALDYITKPFRDERLLTAIRSAVEKGRAQRSSSLNVDQRAPEARSTPARRLLLVEGDLGWRAVLAAVLERLGRVETAPTLDAALNYVSRLRPTCVVLNALRSSAELERFLATLHAHLPACRVLIVSEDRNLQTALVRERLNISGVVRPPVGAGDLIGRIAAIVTSLEAPSHTGPQLGLAACRTIEHLVLHFGAAMSVADLAKVAGISGSHLAHLFRAETGLTVRDCLARVRVEITREMLTHTDESLSEIASFVGFFDASHLSRVFRQIRGQRPSVYRQSSRRWLSSDGSA